MMNKTKSALKRVMAALLCACMLFGTLYTPLSLGLALFAGAAEDDLPKVGFVSDAIATSGNNVTFKIRLDTPVDFDVVVSYHTENRSAVAGVDYDAIRTTVTIERGQTTAEVFVTVKHQQEYVAKSTTGARCFAIVIDGVSEGVGISTSSSTAYGYLLARNILPTTLTTDSAGKDFYYFTQYKNIQYATHSNVSDIGAEETWKSWDEGVSLNNSTTQSWVNTYLKFGLADAWGTMLVDQYSWDDAFNDSNSKITFGDKTWFSGGGSYFFWGDYDPGNENIGHPGDLWNGRAWDVLVSGKNPFDDDVNFWDLSDGWQVMGTHKKMYWFSPYKAWYADSGALTYSQFFKITPHNGVVDLGASFYNGCPEALFFWPTDFRLYGFTLLMNLYDSKKPTVQQTWLDDSSLESTGKLRLIIRFSEPVYASAGSSVSVNLNGNNIAKMFDYAGGNLTDTLYYEWTAEHRNYESYSYKFEETKNDKIGDLAYIVTEYSNLTNNTTGTISSERAIKVSPSINYSNPEITFTPKTTGWSKYHEIDVSFGPVDSGTYYYLWNNDPTDIKDPAAYGDSKFDFNQNMTTISFDKVNGPYYLHVLAVTKYKVSKAATFERAMYFDNAPPEFKLRMKKNSLPNKAFSLEFFDIAQTPGSPGGSGFATLTMTIMDADGRKGKTYVLYDKNKGTQDPLLTVREVNDEFSCVYHSALFDLTMEGEEALTPDDEYFRPDKKITDLMGGQERMTFTIHFTLTDNSGNSVNTPDQKITYDTRDSFGPGYEVGNGISPMKGIDDIEIYDIGGRSSTSLTVRTDQGSGHLRLIIKDDSGELIDGITYNGMQISHQVDATYIPDEITLEGLKPGYYEISPYFVMDSFDDKEEIMVSDVIYIYITSGLGDETENYKQAYYGNNVLRNRVYQLEDTSYHYLPAIGENPKSFYYGATREADTGNYVGGSSAPSFSSMNQMRDYVTYMEYQDMYLVSISASAAKFLNNGTGSTIYVKADGEATFAKEGQLWIRYKRSTWNPSSNSYGWVFYYYGTGNVEDGIDLRSISNNLRNAVYAVRDTICKAATIKYLVEYDTTDSRTGAPRLNETQTHTEYESKTETIMGTPFVEEISYAGDNEIYDNFVNMGSDKPLPLATNMVLHISDETHIYYKYGTDLVSTWTPVDASDGMTVREALPNCSTGLYTILEAGQHGVRQFEIYIDTTTPKLEVILNGEAKTIDNETSMFSGTEFSFSELYGEIDTFAYAAVYSYTSGQLLNVYYENDIYNIELTGSNYYVQVGDRSGNSFTFTLRLANTTLNVTTELSSTGTGVIVTVKDRAESEIYRYEVYCNNVLINSEYIERKLYNLPGIYSVFVQDIYGNTYKSGNVTYTRAAPGITWYYQNSYGTYTAYDPEKLSTMYIVADETAFGQYLISTSALLRFRISEDLGKCLYEFTGIDEKDYNVDTSGNVVTINTLSGWTLKVWYDEYPEDYVTYVCTIDDVAPDIFVTFIGTPYKQNEYETMEKGTTTIPDTLSYTKETNIVMSAENGDIFTGSFISVSASDNFGMRNLTVTLNGSPVSVVADEEGIYHLEAYGKYVVTATDIFNNVNVFTFTNTQDPAATFQADNKPEERSSQTVTSYGRERAVMNVSRSAESEILIKSASGSNYYRFKFSNGIMYQGRYAIMTTDLGKTCVVEWNETPLLEVGVAGVQAGIWVTLDSSDDYTLYAQLTNNGGAKFRVDCVSGTQHIEMRTTTGRGCPPDYKKISLSKEGTDLPIYSGGKVVTTNRDGYVTYVSYPIEIKTIRDEMIVKVEESFSTAMNFNSFETIYTAEEGIVNPYDHERKGFYCVRITNVYGNKLDYILRFSDSASIVVTAMYRDGQEVRFSADYKKEICSNNSITVSVYGQNIKFKVDGISTDPVLDKDCSKLMFYSAGRYVVEVIEASGTVSAYTLVIGSDPTFAFSESWIVGYNESALKRQEGYTNLKLSAVPDLNKVCIVFVEKDGEIVNVYDILSENAQTDTANLRYCIGNSGDGTYTVGFRDLYGDLVTKTIYYRETPTLLLTRVTMASGESESYDISKAIEKGFYSSNSLTFTTEASQYVFTVNGEPVMLDIPKTYEFNTASGNGLFRYDVTYLDEYGFSYIFGAYLLRQELQLSTKNMDLVDIDEVKFTSDDVNVLFNEEYEAYYTLNDGEKLPYRPGQSLKRDGKYNMTVTDIAGNVATLTLTRDSVVNFTFVDSKTEREVIKGGVANNTTVVFHSDEAKITNVFRDGKELEKFTDNRFGLTGKWEILMRDEIGNTAYFCFTLVNNSLKEFSYETPYGYTVSEVWKSDNDGNRFLTAQKGNAIELKEDGIYSVVMLSEWDNMAINYTVTIDTTPPKVKLVGCEIGEETANEVTLEGLVIGDIVSVYRNNELEKEIEIENVRDVPVFTEGGSYEIVIRNLAGVSTSLNFTRKHIANTAASVLIIIGCFALAGGIFVGLLYRNRSKIDK